MKLHTLMRFKHQAFLVVLFCLVPALALAAGPWSGDDDDDDGGGGCGDLPNHADLKAALTLVAVNEFFGDNGGFGLNLWGTMVNRDGEVCAVAFTGGDRGDQWPGSRAISAQKANTANAFSLPILALSTANLFSAVQPDESLFGLQESNPVDVGVAYRGNAKKYGQHNDPMVGRKIGGVNVFGGGLALYDDDRVLLGAIGVSGDTSCADHTIAWRTRALLGLDNTPNDDNIVYDIAPDVNGHQVSDMGFGHPECSPASPIP